ncbi:MAG: DUF2490 domain-containing protein [Chitinophagales bacterium]|nr:DUF2490 domain-containing protein [Bacteroidota bacterium]MCB9043949.1 DUF2490 domain-containing protein [Chitinophagales bacterium]
MKKVFFCLLIFLVYQNIKAQSANEYWLSVAAETKGIKDYALRIEPQIRFEEGTSSYKSLFADIELKHSYNKILSGDVGYRLYANEKKRRFYADVELEFKTKLIDKFKNRFRFQNDHEIDKSDEQTFRYRFMIEKKVFKKKLELSAGVETFFPLFVQKSMDTYRWLGGVGVNLPHKQSLDLRYIVENNKSKKQGWQHHNIFSLGYKYKW